MDTFTKLTDLYIRWVDSFARNHRIPTEWAQKGVRKEDYVLPRLRQMERSKRFGVYFILKSMEAGPSFRIANLKYPTKDPNYRIIAPQKSRYTHVCGPLANSLFDQPPKSDLAPPTKIEAAYRRVGKSIQQIIELMAA